MKHQTPTRQQANLTPGTQIKTTLPPPPHNWIHKWLIEEEWLRLRRYLRNAIKLVYSPREVMTEFERDLYLVDKDGKPTPEEKATTIRPDRFMKWGLTIGTPLIAICEHITLKQQKTTLLTSLLNTALTLQLEITTMAMLAYVSMKIIGSREPLRKTLAAAIFSYLGPCLLFASMAWLYCTASNSTTCQLEPLIPSGNRAFHESLRIALGHSEYPKLINYIQKISIPLYFALTLSGTHRSHKKSAFITGLTTPFIAAAISIIIKTTIITPINQHCRQDNNTLISIGLCHPANNTT